MSRADLSAKSSDRAISKAFEKWWDELPFAERGAYHSAKAAWHEALERFMIVKTVDIKPAMSRADLDAQRVLFEAWWKSHSGLATAFHIWQAALAAQAPVQGHSNSMEIGGIKAPVQGELIGYMTPESIQFLRDVRAGKPSKSPDGDGDWTWAGTCASSDGCVGGGMLPVYIAAPVQAQSEPALESLLPGVYYMDPPDGGSPSIFEQFSRMAEDAARLRWLDQQVEAYGFENHHEGNEWKISGPFNSIRDAIDAARKAAQAVANKN